MIESTHTEGTMRKELFPKFQPEGFKNDNQTLERIEYTFEAIKSAAYTVTYDVFQQAVQGLPNPDNVGIQGDNAIPFSSLSESAQKEFIQLRNANLYQQMESFETSILERIRVEEGALLQAIQTLNDGYNKALAYISDPITSSLRSPIHRLSGNTSEQFSQLAKEIHQQRQTQEENFLQDYLGNMNTLRVEIALRIRQKMEDTLTGSTTIPSDNEIYSMLLRAENALFDRPTEENNDLDRMAADEQQAEPTPPTPSNTDHEPTGNTTNDESNTPLPTPDAPQQQPSSDVGKEAYFDQKREADACLMDWLTNDPNRVSVLVDQLAQGNQCIVYTHIDENSGTTVYRINFGNPRNERDRRAIEYLSQENESIFVYTLPQILRFANDLHVTDERTQTLKKIRKQYLQRKDVRFIEHPIERSKKLGQQIFHPRDTWWSPMSHPKKIAEQQRKGESTINENSVENPPQGLSQRMQAIRDEQGEGREPRAVRQERFHNLDAQMDILLNRRILLENTVREMAEHLLDSHFLFCVTQVDQNMNVIRPSEIIWAKFLPARYRDHSYVYAFRGPNAIENLLQQYQPGLLQQVQDEKEKIRKERAKKKSQSSRSLMRDKLAQKFQILRLLPEKMRQVKLKQFLQEKFSRNKNEPDEIIKDDALLSRLKNESEQRVIRLLSDTDRLESIIKEMDDGRYHYAVYVTYETREPQVLLIVDQSRDDWEKVIHDQDQGSIHKMNGDACYAHFMTYNELQRELEKAYTGL